MERRTIFFLIAIMVSCLALCANTQALPQNDKTAGLKCSVISAFRVENVEGGFASWTAKDRQVATRVILLVKLAIHHKQRNS